MLKTVKSWNSLNEAVNKTKGKHIIRDSKGKKQKIVYKIQDNTKFMVKFIRTADLASDGRLTAFGINQFTTFHNSQLGLVNTFGKLDDSFFKEKIMIYVIKRDTDRVEKIEFKVVPRSAAPGLDNFKFISTKDLEGLESGSDLHVAATDAINTVNRDNILEDPEEIIEAGERDAKGISDLEDLAGRKFRYTMRTNEKLYLMTFTDDGYLQADVIGEDSPNGSVSWEDNKIMWYTDEDKGISDNKWINQNNLPLYTDGEMINKYDKENLTKIFTDSDFREKLLNEYEEEFGSSDITAENIKSMLYHKDGTSIFGEGEITSKEEKEGKVEEPTGPSYSYQTF